MSCRPAHRLRFVPWLRLGLGQALRSAGVLLGLWLAVLPATAQPGAAAPVLPCSVAPAGDDLSQTLRTWIDPGGEATLAQARAQHAGGGFVPAAGPAPAFGFVSGALWVHLSLPATQADCTSLLVLRQPRVLRVDVFPAQGEAAVLAQMGAGLPFDARALSHRFPNVRLQRQAGTATELLLRLVSHASVQLPFELHSDASFYQSVAAEQVLMGVFYGVVVALILFNLSMALSLRDTTYAAAVAYLCAMLLFTLSIMGHGAQWLWPQATFWQERSLAVGIALLLSSAVVFVAKFLDLHQVSPRLTRGMFGLAALQGLMGAAAFVAPVQPLVRLLAASAFISAFLVTYVAVDNVRRGSRAARVLLASWVVLLLFAVLVLLSAFDVVPRVAALEYAMQAGAAAQMLVLSYALLYRANLLRRERLAQERQTERAAHQVQLDERLRASLQERNTILDNLVVGIVLLNPEGRVVWANRAMYELFRVPDGTGLGQSLERYYLTREAYLDVGRTVKEAVGRGEAFVGERRLRRVDGSQFWASISGRAVNPKDVSRGTVWSVLDIEERKRAEDDIRKALAHQQELNVMKTRFVSMASHEFRTPLTAIQSSAELLHHYADRIAPAERADILAQIETAVARMTRMLEDVLVLGRSDSGTAPFHPRPLDVANWCRSLVHDVAQATSSSGPVRPAVVLEIRPEPGQCQVDAILLEHILSNLLSNAIKYSPRGGTVHVRLGRHGPMLRIEVSDEGIGIREQDQYRLFEAFYRASNVGEIPGTGLGLTVVQRAVERHGGTITLDSAPGEGTRSVVEIPAPHLASTAKAPAPQAPDPAPAR